MPLQFHRAVEEMEIWSATNDGYSFVISFFKGFAGPGFHRRPGYVTSWRPLYQGHDAIKIIGSPFKSWVSERQPKIIVRPRNPARIRQRAILMF